MVRHRATGFDYEELRKAAESSDLDLILTAYDEAMGEALTEIVPSETPDFFAEEYKNMVT